MAAVVLLVASVGILSTRSGGSEPAMVIGSTSTTQANALPVPTAPPPPPTGVPVTAGTGAAVPVVTPTLKGSDGRAYGAAIPFNSSIPVPTELTFVLVIGSDARPGQDIRRTNADSVHLLAVNPATREGTIVGFPRDAWVDIPGRGRGKINSAMPKGGPSLLVDTVRRITGLPIQYYALTGFEGLASMVDALGGVDVQVTRRMNDSFSGARFQAGWHHFNGAQALAFTRNRHDVANGDFGRSENHGTLMLAALGKMRTEIGDDVGIRKWVEVILRHASLDVTTDRLPRLAALARNLDPARIRNVVLPGRIGNAGGGSVVYLDPGITGIFTDLRDDAVIGGSTADPTPSTSSTFPPEATSTTTTTAGLLPAPTTTTTDPDTPPTTGGVTITLLPPQS